MRIPLFRSYFCAGDTIPLASASVHIYRIGAEYQSSPMEHHLPVHRIESIVCTKYNKINAYALCTMQHQLQISPWRMMKCTDASEPDFSPMYTCSGHWGSALFSRLCYVIVWCHISISRGLSGNVSKKFVRSCLNISRSVICDMCFGRQFHDEFISMTLIS